MTSPGGTKSRGVSHNSKNNEQLPQRTFCQNLCNFLPCLKRHVSPASSRSSSKNSKNSFFLENHYVIKCPKKKGAQNKRDGRNVSKTESEKISTICEQHKVSVTDFEKKSDHKEVRFLGASKKKCDKDNYLKLLGMEPNDYLNQFSSVFIKNLKSPVPKDPCILPKKFNVYIPPKGRKKMNRSVTSLGGIADVRNVIQYRQGQLYTVDRSFSSVAKQKCGPSFKNINASGKNHEDNRESLAKQLFESQISPTCSVSTNDLNKNKNKYPDESLKDADQPWQCSDSITFHKFFGASKKLESKSKHVPIGERSAGKNEIKSKSNLKRLKNYLRINSETNKKNKIKRDFYNRDAERSDLCDNTLYRTKEISDSDVLDEDGPIERNPWPKQNFLHLRAQINDKGFKRAALQNSGKNDKTLVWKLIIKNQKEYIKR